MKKILFGFLTIVATMLFVSCSNDDIAITRDVTIKVNTANVISHLSAEAQNTISAIGTDRSVRTLATLYDTNGNLVKSVYGMMSSFGEKQFSMQGITEGTYTLITFVDIIDNNSTKANKDTFWGFYDFSTLSTAKISRLDGDVARNGIGTILGVSSQKITIDGDNKEIVVNPTMPGSIIRTEYYNIHAFSAQNLTRLRFVSGKMSDSMAFDSNGNYVNNFNTDYYYFLNQIDVADYSNDPNDIYYHYAYAFHLSGSTISLNVLLYYNNSTTEFVKASNDDIFVNLGNGEEWTASIDLKALKWSVIKSSSVAKQSVQPTSYSKSIFAGDNNTLYLSSISK